MERKEYAILAVIALATVFVPFLYRLHRSDSAGERGRGEQTQTAG